MKILALTCRNQREIYLIVFFTLISFSVLAQSYATVVGQGTVITGSTEYYTYSLDPGNGITVHNPQWTYPTSLASEVTRYNDDYTMTLVLHWNTAGSGTITAKANLSPLDDLSVNVITCVSYPVPTNVLFSNVICGSGSTTITASPAGGGTLIRWYAASSGGDPIYYGTSYPTPTLGTTTTYYISSGDSSPVCGDISPRLAVTAVVNPIPGLPGTGAPTVTCRYSAVDLSVTPGANGSVVWYDAPSGGNVVGSGNVLHIPSLTAATSYYPATVNSVSGCTSGRVQVIANIVTTPESTSGISADMIYGSGTTVINATPGSSGDNVKWFDTETSPTPIYTGLSFTTPPLSASRVYYIATHNTALNCTSEGRTMITVTVSPLISPGRVLQEIIRVKDITQDTQIGALTSSEKKSVAVYFDGLQRTNQQVLMKASPSGKDVVQPLEFDVFGRTTKSYLPYVATTTDGSFQSTYAVNQNDFYDNSADKVKDDDYPFALSVYEDSPLGRIKEQGGAGEVWQPGTGHTGRMTYTFNLAGEVRQFNPDATSTIFYPANTLSKIEQLDENGNKIIVFQNSSGRTLLKRRQLDEMINGSMVNYLDTYFLYDDLDRIKYVVSPKGAAQLQAGGWSFTQNLLDQFVYQFVYDARGRVIEKKVPGQAWRYFGYDNLNRLVLAQDGSLRLLNKWIFFKYDKRGQPVMHGLYLNVTQNTRPAMQTILDGLYSSTNTSFPASAYYENRGATLHGYTNVSFPATNADNTALDVMTVNYYDTYDLDLTGGDDFVYTAQGLTGEGSSGVSFGLPTASKKVILGTSTWLYNYIFYDKYGRTIQVRSNNHLSAALDNLITVVYDFEGKVTYRKTYHNAGAGKVTTVLNRFNYSTQGRLLQVYQKNNTDAEQLVAQYDYNELGQVVAKKLHGTGGDGTSVTADPVADQAGVLYSQDITSSSYSSSQHVYRAKQSITLNPGFDTSTGGTFDAAIGYSQADAQSYNLAHSPFVQIVDYRYNIRGWLTSINNAQLTVDSKNDDANDFFGMEVLYDKFEAGLNNQSGDKQYFDGSVSAMKWKAPGVVAGADNQRSYKFDYDKSGRMKTAAWQVSQVGAWTGETGVQNEALTYDQNGNILTLKRKHNLRGLSGVVVTATAELMDDLSYTYAAGDQLSKVEDAVSVNIGKGDFKNGDNTTTEYTYDTHGNITVDKNKGITAVTYNYLQKPQLINFADGRKIEYVYDASGAKLTMKTYNTAAVLQSTTDYVGGFVYTNNTLGFFASPEGRVVKTGSNLEYQYAIADHQGNTRIVFTSVTPTTETVTATFETAAQIAESHVFTDSYPAVSGINTVATNAHSGTSSQMLNAGYMGMVGVAKSYKVYPGDRLKIEAYARYDAPSATNGGLSNFSGVLLAALGLPTPAVGEFGTSSSAIQGWGALEAGGYALGSPSNGNPKAFVNIILFDKDYKFLDAAYAQVNSSGAPTLISSSYTVKEPGYAYLYISNEQPTQTDIYFDDVSMSYTPTSVVQYSEYYPFGLQTANSWTRDNTTNNFLYNAANELNEANGWYEMFYRGYDPALGRMLQVDPLAVNYASHTPYQYALNSPVVFTDPFGDRLLPIGDATPYMTGGNPDSIFMGGSGGGWASDLQEHNNMLSNGYGNGIKIGSNGDAYVYNPYAGSSGEWVSALEIVNFRNPNQRESYVEMAYRALNLANNITFYQAGFGEVLGSIELAIAGLKPTFDGAAYMARLQGGVGNVPLFLKKNLFQSPLVRGNNALYVGRVSSTTAIRTAGALSKAAPIFGALGVVTNTYDIVQDGKLTAGDGFQAINTGLMLAFPVYGVIYGVVDLGFGVFSDQSLTDRIKSGIDANVSGSVDVSW